MYSDIMVFNDYLTTFECDELYQIFRDAKFRELRPDDIWVNRVKHPEYTEYYKNKLISHRTAVCENFFNIKFNMTSINMTLWKEGHEMPPHLDYGAWNEYPDREYASILYLNDDYEGGELYITDLKITIKPKKGQLVCFQGGKYMHGVKKIITGERLTNICWFKKI